MEAVTRIPDNFTYVLSIAETGNLSAAAKELGVSDLALSKYLAELEDELGTELFLRYKNSRIQPLQENLSGSRYPYHRCERADISDYFRALQRLPENLAHWRDSAARFHRHRPDLQPVSPPLPQCKNRG